MFEMTVSFTLNPLRPGVVDLGLPHKLQDQHRMMFPPGRHITAEAGKELGAWARGDDVVTPDRKLWASARRAAHGGRDSLRSFSTGLSEDDRVKLRPIAPELNRTAKVSDQNIGASADEPDQSSAEDVQRTRPKVETDLPQTAIKWGDE